MRDKSILNGQSPWLFTLTLCVWAPALLGQENVSSGGWVESDLYLHSENPPEAILDGDDRTHYCHHRVEDTDFRLWLARPADLTRVTFIQGWGDWDQPTAVRLETADGTQRMIDLVPATREGQSFDLDFPNATAFVDIYIVSVQDDGDDSEWGGFAEITFEGFPVDSDLRPPVVENIDVSRVSDTAADVSWTTSEPATSQVKFSSTARTEIYTSPDLSFARDHSVHIETDAPLMGYLEIRSADEEGNRAETRVDAFNTMDTSYLYGVGGWSFHIGDRWVPAPELFVQDGMEVDFIQTWISDTMAAEWFRPEDITLVAESGFIPEVIHYYFGDPGSVERVQSMSAEYIEDITYLANLIAESGAGDRVIVTLEPEFNQQGVQRWDGWNDLMIEAIDILHSTAGCKVGVLAGDWDIDHVLPISMGRAAAVSDFVAFQEMRASTRNEMEDAHDVPERAIRLAHYMSRKFMRPVRWGYVMVSDYGGWTEVQRQVVVEICERGAELESAGVVAVAWMSYMDNPGAGGYFDEAEAHKGLKYSDNEPKPAFHIWKECAANGPTWQDAGTWPDGGEPYMEDWGGCGCTIVH